MDSEQLLAALREDIEWPAATVRLLYNYLDPLDWAGTANSSLNLSLASDQVLPVSRGRISTQGSPCRSSSTACGNVLLNTSFKAPVLVLPSRNQITCGGEP
jgi:hypothetical protein